MSDYYVVLCPQCTTVAYRSRKPLDADSKLVASDFVATDPSFPAPTDGKPLLCPACSSVMKVAPEGVAKKYTDGPDSSPREPVPFDQRIPESNSSSVATETLFAVRSGETVKNIVERKDCIIVITDKRIERIVL